MTSTRIRFIFLPKQIIICEKLFSASALEIDKANTIKNFLNGIAAVLHDIIA